MKMEKVEGFKDEQTSKEGKNTFDYQLVAYQLLLNRDEVGFEDKGS